jgi:CRISPR-associated protein Cas1
MLLSACMNEGIALIVTDETHTPSGVALPFHRHHRQADVARVQADASLPLKKRLWQVIVRAKIENQAAALDSVASSGSRTLREIARRVGSGDQANLEAQAARYYWSQFWTAFRRKDDQDHRNMLLNYGYAVVRSGVARALVASGLLPAFGLKHASVSNAFNLADDLVEPFRPFIDVMAWRRSEEEPSETGELSVADRQHMAGALLASASFAGETITLLNAAERTAESLVRCLEAGTAGLLQLPALPP